MSRGGVPGSFNLQPRDQSSLVVGITEIVFDVSFRKCLKSRSEVIMRDSDTPSHRNTQSRAVSYPQRPIRMDLTSADVRFPWVW